MRLAMPKKWSPIPTRTIFWRDMSTVKMRQVNSGKWEIVTAKGHVLQQDLFIGNAEYAEVYIKNFCSSFVGWSYEMIPLTQEELDEARVKRYSNEKK